MVTAEPRFSYGSTWILTPESTPRQTPTPRHSFSEDGDGMESGKPSRAASVLYANPRPTLDDVLSDRAQPPYTLTAFMAYLSQNHCLETLEFTLDAQRYGEHYAVISQELGESPIRTQGQQSQHLCMLFQRLLTAYIAPGSQREINLPSSVRDTLLSHSQARQPPHPSDLDPAVKRMRDLMDESIFMHFLNSRSASQQPGHLNQLGRNTSTSQRGAHSTPFGHTARGGYPSSTQASASGDSVSGNLTDDSGSIPSSPGDPDPVTPPMTPPSSDLSSPNRGSRQDNTWKKMGMKFGWKR